MKRVKRRCYCQLALFLTIIIDRSPVMCYISGQLAVNKTEVSHECEN
jgi:hypothetical protein